MSDPLDGFEAFSREVRSRLDAGRREYGDRSFAAHPDALLVELGQEALDLAGWGYVLWHRIQAARAALAAHGSQAVEPPKTPPRGA